MHNFGVCVGGFDVMRIKDLEINQWDMMILCHIFIMRYQNKATIDYLMLFGLYILKLGFK